jgi:hypothetical protein
MVCYVNAFFDHIVELANPIYVLWYKELFTKAFR